MIDEDFYVGYVPRASGAVRRWMRGTAVGLCALGLAAAFVLIFGQQPFDASTFEYQQYRPYEGELIAWPYPVLISPGGRFLLVSEGKHGISEAARGLDGRRVALQGALIRRGPDRMLEVLAGSIRQQSAAPNTAASPDIDLGAVTLAGEIVDSKCYLGVMNPGNGKVHRDCAVRCISGGIPPAFLVRDADGQSRVLLLTGSDLRPLSREVLSFAAEPIVIKGRLARRSSQLVLKAEPRDFQRE